MSFFDRFKKQPVHAPEEATPAAEESLGQTQAAVAREDAAELPTSSPEEQASTVAGPSAIAESAGEVGTRAVYELRRFVPVPEERFNLDDTSRMAELFETPREQRGMEWLQNFQQAAWNGSILLPEQPVFVGPDGMGYVRLELPPPGRSVQTNCLSNIYASMAMQGFGAAIFRNATDPPEAAEYVMPTGILESLRAFGTWDGDPADTAEMLARAERDAARAARGEEESSAGKPREVMVGTPAESYLPRHTAALLYRHLTEGWKMEDPRVALIVDEEMTPSRNLVISRKFSDFPDHDTAGHAARMLQWYLPPRRLLLLMPEEWTTEQMRPLKELC